MNEALKKILYKSLKLLGIGIILFRAEKNRDIVPFDRNELSKYLIPSEDYELYKSASEAVTKKKSKPDSDIYKELRFFSLIQMVKFVLHNGVTGDFAECGCYRGHSSYIISTLIKEKSATYKEFLIFDSFAGLSKRDRKLDKAKSTLDEKIINQEVGKFSCSEEEVKENLAAFNFIKFYKGWIPDRFTDVKQTKFCFVHIDVDLYQPTYDALSFFFPKLSIGGVIVIDDYGYSAYQGAELAVKHYLKDKSGFFFYAVPTGSAFILKSASHSKV